MQSTEFIEHIASPQSHGGTGAEGIRRKEHVNGPGGA
jgi:hypothetical protein